MVPAVVQMLGYPSCDPSSELSRDYSDEGTQPIVSVRNKVILQLSNTPSYLVYSSGNILEGHSLAVA